jgi:arylsulfatase A-like enzyme
MPILFVVTLGVFLVRFAILLSLAVTSISLAEDAKKPRPHIVYILVDDLGWADVGWHGKDIRTPNLDKLAKNGVRLEQFYVQHVCSPTRAALLTGRYPMRHGLQVGVVRPWAQYGLPLEERTLPQALKEVGYTTAIVGKWHLGHHKPDYLPTRRGFDFQYGHYNGQIDYNTHIRDDGHDWHRNDKANYDEGYATKLLADEAVRLVKEQSDKNPLFLYLPFNAVHAPYQVPAKYLAEYGALPKQRRTYAAMVTSMDEAVGQVVSALEKRDWMKNTLFLFSSDNGGPAPGTITSNGELRAGKGTLYEGGVRVPAFASWTGTLPANQIRQTPMHAVDIYPTLLNLVGAPTKQKLPVDGLDLWPMIKEGKAVAERDILLNATPDGGAIRRGDWKLHIVKRDEGNRIELYNLAHDPNEKNDLAKSKPEKVAALRKGYDALAKQATPPNYQPKPPGGFVRPKVWGEQSK